MAVGTSIVLDGLLKPDGTLELFGRPGLPPGPVLVRLEAAPKSESSAEHLPDSLYLDECIPAPFDLPLPGTLEFVELRHVSEFLPDAHDVEDRSGA